MMAGKLYLIPNTLGSDVIEDSIPTNVANIAINLSHFIVEDLRTVRRFLRKLDREFDIDGSTFYLLNNRTKPQQFAEYIKPLKAGVDMGIISEAGCPGVADPGAEIAKLAHENGITVVPLVGPSSILLALMASGMNGQSFAFNGYLPINRDERAKALKELEHLSRIKNQSQIFIETPYRNVDFFNDILKTCSPNTRLCVASNLTLKDEFVKTKKISQWKNVPDINKKPTIFIIHG